MRKKIVLLSSAFLLFFALSFYFTPLVLAAEAPAPAATDASSDYGLKATAKAAEIKTGGSIQAVIGRGVGALLSLMGILFFLLALYGGFLWMTARGDHTQVDKAKGIIIDAVIGLVIIGASWIITRFVFTSFG